MPPRVAPSALRIKPWIFLTLLQSDNSPFLSQAKQLYSHSHASRSHSLRQEDSCFFSKIKQNSICPAPRDTSLGCAWPTSGHFQAVQAALFGVPGHRGHPHILRTLPCLTQDHQHSIHMGIIFCEIDKNKIF